MSGIDLEEIVKLLIIKVKNNNQESDLETYMNLKSKVELSACAFSESEFRHNSRGRGDISENHSML